MLEVWRFCLGCVSIQKYGPLRKGKTQSSSLDSDPQSQTWKFLLDARATKQRHFNGFGLELLSLQRIFYIFPNVFEGSNDPPPNHSMKSKLLVRPTAASNKNPCRSRGLGHSSRQIGGAKVLRAQMQQWPMWEKKSILFLGNISAEYYEIKSTAAGAYWPGIQTTAHGHWTVTTLAKGGKEMQPQQQRKDVLQRKGLRPMDMEKGKERDQRRVWAKVKGKPPKQQEKAKRGSFSE